VEKDVTREAESVKRPAEPAGDDARNNGKPTVRHGSDEEFKKAHKKTSTAHAGLFRRLAQ
jgi:hypothetical protein